MGNMEKRPTLEEVKEYFKDAKTIEGIYGNSKYEVNTVKLGVHFDKYNYRQNEDSEGRELLIWEEKAGYAKIITYKDNDMKITKFQIQELDKGNTTVRVLFPDVFEKPFSLNKWYKSKNHPLMLIYPTDETKEGHLFGYGFNNYGSFISIPKEANSNCLCNSTGKHYLKEAT